MMPFVPWNPRPRHDDATLARRVAGGDREALAAVYARDAGPVYRYALALCGNPSWAADAVQEAFIALATRPDGFDAARGPLGAWLAGVARHTLLAQWRSAQQHTRLHDGVDVDGIGDELDGTDLGIDAAPGGDALMVHKQELDALWRAVRALPWPFREALVLVDLQERPYAEAAAIAGVEINTLRSRLHRARARLAALLCAGETQ
jgi:RNA polymerase sigma-70 factor (ECF subfamily)